MKKFLLSALALCAASAMFADSTVLFEDDFEWLEPWAITPAGADNLPAGDAMGTNDEACYAPQLPTTIVNEQSTLQALEAKGYGFIRENLGKENPGECTYLQKNYLKFGKKDYQAGIIFPAFAAAAENVTFSFDWGPQRQGKNNYDPTKLIVIVANPGAEDMIFDVPAHTQNSGDPLKWFHADIALTGATINENTKITLRPGAEDWSKSGQHRFYLDNVKFTGEAASVANVTVDANAPVEYFNLNGIRVANPENGIFIRRQGANVSKVIVK